MTDKEKRDKAVDAFAAAIKERLDQQAAKGYVGWDGQYPSLSLRNEIEGDAIRLRLLDHDEKLAIDIGARAMMLHFRASNTGRQVRREMEEGHA